MSSRATYHASKNRVGPLLTCAVRFRTFRPVQRAIPLVLLLKRMQKHAAIFLLSAASVLGADYAAEGRLWWSHIQFLADDKLEGRSTGSAGFRKAVAYVSGQ